MTPRNMQLGASASAVRTPSLRVVRPATSTASRSTTPARPARGKAPARKPAKRDASARQWWLLPLAIIGVLAIFVAVYYPVARVQYRETRERARLAAELGAIQSRNERLRTEVARLKTPEGVEDYARVQLGMVKKGEHVAVVIDGTETSAAALAQGTPKIDSQEAVEPTTGPWAAFFNAVFGVQ